MHRCYFFFFMNTSFNIGVNKEWLMTYGGFYILMAITGVSLVNNRRCVVTVLSDSGLWFRKQRGDFTKNKSDKVLNCLHDTTKVVTIW